MEQVVLEIKQIVKMEKETVMEMVTEDQVVYQEMTLKMIPQVATALHSN